MFYALYWVIRDALRASESSSAREARIIKKLCLRPGAFGGKKK